LSSIFVTDQGALLKKSGRRLIITKDKKIIHERHFSDVSRILLFGNIQLSTQLISSVLHEGIDVSFFSMFGKYKGKLVGQNSKNIYTKLSQLTYWNDKEFSLALAKETIAYKILGQQKVLMKRRHGINITDAPMAEGINKLHKYREEVIKQTELSNLRGVEGISSKTYFSCWDYILPEEFPFEKRSRRPALNEVNSVLNFSYTLLLNEITGILNSYGFDVLFGYYHSVKYGRISLTLDVMELFRPILIDQWVIQMFRERKITKNIFSTNEENGIRFTDEGIKLFLAQYQKWINHIEANKLIETYVKGLEKSYMEGKVDGIKQGAEKVLPYLL
jgi:CRISP-associated protein Cas1